MPISPMVARWELALRLRERRRELGVLTATVTRELGFSPAYLSHIEGERNLLSEAKLKPLLALLEFDNKEQQELLELRAAAKERGWWTRYSAIFGSNVLRLYGLEHGARSVRSYQNVLMPGLLQSEPYARAVIEASVFVRQIDTNQAVEVRLKRQERLTGEAPLQFTALLCEAALRQQIGGLDVQLEQLQHLSSVVKNQPNVDVRVIPFATTGTDIFGASSFHLLGFSNPLPTLAWNESVTVGAFIEDETLVRDLCAAYDQAQAQALGRDDSLTLVEDLAAELRSRP